MARLKGAEIAVLFAACGATPRAVRAMTYIGPAKSSSSFALMNFTLPLESIICAPKAPWNGALPRPLKLLLAEELRAGNSIQHVAGTHRDPDTVMLVLLERPFLRRATPLPATVRFRQPKTPDAWPSEYYTESPKFILASAAA